MVVFRLVLARIVMEHLKILDLFYLLFISQSQDDITSLYLVNVISSKLLHIQKISQTTIKSDNARPSLSFSHMGSGGLTI